MKYLAAPLLCLIFFRLAPAQTAAAPDDVIVKPDAPPETTQQMADRVLKATSALRGLAIKRPVTAGIKSKPQVEKMAAEEMAKQSKPNELRAIELLLKKLGLAPQHFNLKRYYVSMLGEQLAGYYDPKTRNFYTTDGVSSLQMETVMAHELTHALQDQHFDLGRLEKWPRHESDSKLAYVALVEGDATLCMMQYMLHNPLQAIGALASSLVPSNSQIVDDGPRALRESLVFPYLQGMTFARALHDKGRFPAVSAAFKNLPQSSEQILHPEKYFSRDNPRACRLPDFTRQLGQGWKLLDNDVNGELGFRLILQEFQPDSAAVNTAAAGWAGDRYQIYEGPKGQALFAQFCAWDSEKDATEFFGAYATRTTARYNQKPEKSTTTTALWKTNQGQVWLEKRKAGVVILEGWPTGKSPASAANRAFAQK